MRKVIAVASCVLAAPVICGAQICGSWEPMPGPAGLTGVSGRVRAITLHDDGSGQKVYIGGEFVICPENAPVIRNLAVWDGAAWGPVSPTPAPTISTMAWFDDGSGPALYTASSVLGNSEPLDQRLRRFRGGAWEVIPASYSILSTPEFHILEFDGAPRLYLRWRFIENGAQCAIAEWTGAGFEVVGPNLPSSTALEAFSGELYATASAAGFQGLFTLDNGAWIAVPGAPIGARSCLEVHDAGSGPRLYLGGSGVYAFDGAAFTPVGTGLSSADRLHSWDTGQERRLIGLNNSEDRLYRLQGSTWTPYLLPDGSQAGVDAIGSGTVAGASRLFIGGNFASVDGVPSSSVFAMTPTSPTILAPGTIPIVTAAAMYDAGQGAQLHIAGDLSSAGGVPLNRIARFDGAAYVPLGSGLDGRATEMLVYDDGSGPALFVAGKFLTAGPHIANSIAKWNGTSWSPLGPGLRQSTLPGEVHALAVYDDGTGPALYAAGGFNNAGALTVANIARWDGSAWSAVGAGLGGPPVQQMVRSLAVHDDGSGPALVAAGDFTSSGATPLPFLAAYRGSGWSTYLGGADSNVNAIGVFDDGGGAALFAAGLFTEIGGATVQRHARWRAGAWSQPDPAATVGSFSSTSPHGFGSLATAQRPFCFFYSTRSFGITYAGGITRYISAWDGESWHNLGGGPGDWVHTMLPIEDPADPRIVVGGEFTHPGGIESPGIALWRSCPACYANCDQSTAAPVLNVADFTCFLQEFAAGASYANCDGSTVEPVLNVADFSCFLQSFAAGCR